MKGELRCLTKGMARSFPDGRGGRPARRGEARRPESLWGRTEPGQPHRSWVGALIKLHLKARFPITRANNTLHFFLFFLYF